MGRPLRGTTRYAVLVPQAAIHGTRRHYPWSHLGTTPPVSWSYRGHFRGTNRGARTKAVVPAWSLVSHGKSGLWDHRGPSPLSWGRDHGWSWDHSTVGPRMVPAPRRGGPAPRAATGHRGRARARGLTAIVDGDGSEAARRPPGPPLGLSGRVPRVRPTCRRAPRRPATRVARRHGPAPAPLRDREPVLSTTLPHTRRSPRWSARPVRTAATTTPSTCPYLPATPALAAVVRLWRALHPTSVVVRASERHALGDIPASRCTTSATGWHPSATT